MFAWVHYSVSNWILIQADEEDTKLKDGPFVMNKEDAAKYKKETEQYEAEKKAGDAADLFATNQHHSYPDKYQDLGRRFVFQYPYKEKSHLNEHEEAEAKLDNTVLNFRDDILF
ncbi:uncharacterized protein [Epargyreus clarus]|uniref:uncharacterized protein n=1 Tax=Epargyreus clarus TaxID=520877 RepID=UPI003C2F2287